MKKFIFLFFLFSTIIIAGCTSSESFIKDLGVDEFEELISDKDVFVIDTHIPEQKHIRGTNAFISYNKLELNLNKLPSNKNTPIAVYCRSGSMSEKASKTLQSLGYKKVYNLVGGANAWKEKGKEFDANLIEYQNIANKITVYKSVNCGCCVGYVGELQKKGYVVEVVPMDDMSLIKQKYNIPRDMESCHTSIIGDYFVEGHMPIEAVERLLEEKPDIDGIALPGMPAGSLGMPGIKTSPYKIYSISGGVSSIFMES